MEIFWYIVLMVILTVYIILDGYDFGAGIVHLFFAKKEKDKKVVFRLNFVLVALVILSLSIWHKIEPLSLHNFMDHPWFFIFPLIAITGLFGLFKVKSFKKDGVGFIFSSLFLFGGLTTTVASIFPKVLPSTNDVVSSLTVFNSSTENYGLSVGVYWFVIAIILVAIYMFVQYRVFSGKMDDNSYGEH